jgi:hypothetical protein
VCWAWETFHDIPQTMRDDTLVPTRVSAPVWKWAILVGVLDLREGDTRNYTRAAPAPTP